MFQKIQVCTDLSPASDALIHCVEELRSIGMEEVILCHVIFVANTPGLDKMLIADALPTIERQKKILEDQGIRVTVEMPFGFAAHSLNQTAENHDVSAILIGSHGKGILRAAVLGSVSEKLLHESRRPVLLVRFGQVEGPKSHFTCCRLFSNVLFPTDFSETAENALSYIGKIVSETKCAVTIMHVIQKEQADAEDEKRLEEDSQFLLESKRHRLETFNGGKVNISLTSGEPEKEILSMSREGSFSLIVMGRQGKGKRLAREVFFGSVSKEVVRHAAVPILFIPAMR